MKNEELIEKALERYKQAQDAEADMREQAIDDIKFANGDQWDDRTLEARRGRPSLTVNKIQGTLKQVRGDQRKLEPQIKVKPVDSGSDPEVAEILNGLIKNIEYNSGAKAAYDTAFDQALDGGWGYFRINSEYSGEDTFEQDICIRRVTNPFSVLLDPSFNEADAADIQWAFISEVITKEEFEEKYPKLDEGGMESSRGEEQSDWWTHNGVRVAEYWYKEPVQKDLYQLTTGDVMDEDMIKQAGLEVVEFQDTKALVAWSDEVDENGEKIPKSVYEIERERQVDTEKVMWCKINGTDVLEGPIERPGRYIPIVIVMGEESYVNGERKLTSAHHYARDAQKVYNWMVSTSVETVSMAPKQPWILTPQQVENHEKQWNVAHARPMPYLLYNHIPSQPGPQRQEHSVPDSGATNERMQAADDIKSTTGIYDASLGAQGNEKSGVAIRARQAEGDMATFSFISNLERAIRHAGRIIIDLIPYIYDSERIIRIMGADGTEKFVPINKTVVDPGTGQAQTLNDVTQGKYDVVVDVGPAYDTQREEASKYMIDLIKTLPGIAPYMLDLVVKYMDWPGASEIQARIQKMQQQQGQQQQDPEKELDVKKAQLEVQGKQLENMKDVQDLAEQYEETTGQDNLNNVAEAAVVSTLQRLGIMPGQNPGQGPQRNA